jgi:hypothetical protein
MAAGDSNWWLLLGFHSRRKSIVMYTDSWCIGQKQAAKYKRRRGVLYVVVAAAAAGYKD